MRIAVLAENFPPRSGGIAVAHKALGELLSSNHTVRYYAFDDESASSDETCFRAKGSKLLAILLEQLLVCKVRQHARVGTVTCVREIARTFASVKNMTKDLRNFSPDIIIVSDHQVPLLGLKNNLQSKIIWIAHHNYTRFLNNPFLPVPCEYDYFLSHRLERRAAKRCDFAVFPSSYMEGIFRNTLNDAVPGKRIPNYSNATILRARNMDARNNWGILPEEIAILFPSGGSPIKGARFLPELIRRINQFATKACFCISGYIDDALNREIEYLRGYCKILTPGKLIHTQNLEFSSATDFCISPTLIENYSCAILECQAMGLPVITFDIGGNKEIVEHNKTGWSVEFPNIDEIVYKAKLLIENSLLRNEMSHLSLMRAKRLNSASDILDNYNDIFSQLQLHNLQRKYSEI